MLNHTHFHQSNPPIWHRPRHVLIGLGLSVLLLLGSTGFSFARESSPALNSLVKLLGTHHYHQVLRQTSALLNLDRTARRQRHLNRYDLLTLRAEAMLHLKLFDGAVDNYHAAAKATSKVSDARLARATADLISHSVAGYYLRPASQVDHSPATRLSILSAASRQDAMKAFYQNQWMLLKPRLASAQRSRTLTHTIRLFPALRIAVDAETAASVGASAADDGADSSTARPAEMAVADASQHMVTLIEKAMTTMQARIKAIQTSANTLVPVGLRHGFTMVPRGVTPREVSQLQGIIQTCRDIKALVQRFNRLYPDFPKECRAMHGLLHSAAHVASSAKNTLP